MKNIYKILENIEKYKEKLKIYIKYQKYQKILKNIRKK